MNIGCEYFSGRVLDYVVEPVKMDLPLVFPDTTKLLHVGTGRAHTIVVTDREGGKRI